ncbi:sulfite exporter TauE/SafE family protein, partial [Candidatus Peregrinibacteria bacterium]|nr:sulfite exporter TauE/SafE family protein [Candidatus Peregrinibacteria bacterium]
SSFSGGGSSLVVFPALLTFAVGSYASLFVIAKLSATVMTFVAGKMHMKRSDLDRRVLYVLIIFGFFGMALGTYFLQYHFDEILFKRLLTFFILATVAYLGFSKEVGLETGHSLPLNGKRLFVTGVFSFLINIMNGIFGGTGLFTTVFLVIFLRMRFIKAIGYTMVNYAVIGIFQTGYLMLTEKFDVWLAVVAVFASIIGGYAGTHLQYLKGNIWVKTSALVVMIFLGIKMVM